MENSCKVSSHEMNDVSCVEGRDVEIKSSPPKIAFRIYRNLIRMTFAVITFAVQDKFMNCRIFKDPTVHKSIAHL